MKRGAFVETVLEEGRRRRREEGRERVGNERKEQEKREVREPLRSRRRRMIRF